ncbi:hypothetical protein EPH95_15010 [Salicibibacter halophilus]|uniref:Uncharacterized protein n=1 Tax=Salicibibacter halophilus TaxID=2502791 RepID=A0A514LKE9_9BACI|nr:hypothetical protein [Salicibibacter halophilus]QDI92338.1 hypothetical protein EPH95_15010 [Salicibibacter halophilus]
MNKAGKFLVTIFACIALLVSAGLVYMFVVGSSLDDDELEIEDVSAQTTENTEASHPDGEVIWSAELDDLSIEDFSISGSDEGVQVKIPDSIANNDDIEGMEEAFEDLPINVVKK